MQDLRALLAGSRDDVPLDVAALQIAQIEYPEVNPAPFLEILDSYAREVGDRLTSRTNGEDFVATLNQYLFEELGFAGNDQEYYHPGNSCLNEVLTKRVGIPITLSVVYIEIARRLGREVHGIGIPGHFIVQYSARDYSVFVDCFHGGELLFERECLELAREATGRDFSDDKSILQPVPKRQILVRMLNNLRSIYFERKEHRKAIEVLNLLLEATPGAADEHKQRAVCYLQLEMLRPAQADFEAYLRLAPDAPDREQIRGYLNRVEDILSEIN